MANSIDQFNEMMDKIKERQQQLDEFKNSAPENQEPSELDMALEESSDAANRLKALQSEAKVNKLARKLDEDENSSFNLKKKYDSPEDIYEDVVGQFRPDPELSESGEPVLTPEQLASSPESSQDPSSNIEEKYGSLNDVGIQNNTEYEIPQTAPVITSTDKPDVQQKIATIMTALKTPTKADDDEALKSAYRNQDIMNALSQITSGVNKAASSYAGKGLTQIKSDSDVGKFLQNLGKSGVEREKELQGLAEKKRKEALQNKLTDLKILQTQAKIAQQAGGGAGNDANSPASKAAQEQAMALMGSLGIKYDPEKIKKLNANTIGSKNFTAGLRKSVNKLSEKRLESTETERFNKWTEKKEDDLTKAIDKFNADKEVVRSNSMISGAKIARDMVLSDNPIAMGSIPNFLARASGEVGALTEADKEPFGGTRAIIERTKQVVQQMVDGKLTEANRKFVIDLANVYENTASNVLKHRADIRAKQLGGIDFPIEMIRGRFLGTDRSGMTKQALPVTGRTLIGADKDAYQWAKDNENDPRAKAILKRLGME